MTVSVSAKGIFQDSCFEENKILWPELRSLMWYVFDTSTWEMVRQGDFELKAHFFSEFFFFGGGSLREDLIL